MVQGKQTQMVANFFRKLRRREDGNVAIIFALSVIPIFLLMGFAIDLQQVNTSKNRVQYILDSAVIAGAREMQDGKNSNQIKAYIKNYVESSLRASGGSMGCQDPITTVAPATQDISVDIYCNQKTAIMQLAGVSKIDFLVTSASTYGIGKVDIAFVFDTSGSMSGSRNAALKEAAELAVDVLLPADSSLIDTGDVRIGMISYSYGVNAGDFFTAVTNKPKRRTYTETYEEEVETRVCTWSWGSWCLRYEYQTTTETRTSSFTVNNTCVKERLGTEAFKDSDPGPYAWIEAMGATYNSYSNSWSRDINDSNCNSLPPVPLTSNRSKLYDYIDDLPASGGTAGHLGIAWGWYLIAPEWSSIWPSTSKPWDYDEPDTAKAMIMMTDGDFLNEYNLGAGHGDSTAQSKILCDNIKARGVKIYTVAFQAPAAGKAILGYCASGPELAFTPENSDELKDAYTHIAQSISDLRISY